MANRAYLFSSDRDGPGAWLQRHDIYYDSRWIIPVSWWFLFRAQNIRLVEVRYRESSWHVVKFVAGRDEALAAFAGRREVLSRLLGPADDGEMISRFLGDVRRWPGKYLFMDPEDVFVARDEPGEGHHLRCAHILEVIDAVGATAADVAGAMKPYSSVEFEGRDEEEFIGQVVGYTYR